MCIELLIVRRSFKDFFICRQTYTFSLFYVSINNLFERRLEILMEERAYENMEKMECGEIVKG